MSILFQLVHDIVMWVIEQRRTAGIATLFFIAVGTFKACIGEQKQPIPPDSSYEEHYTPLPSQPYSPPIKLEIPYVQLQKIFSQLYEKCHDESNKQTFCGEKINTKIQMKDSSALDDMSKYEFINEFKKQSLLAMYRTDIIRTARITHWEYLKIKNYLPQIDGFVTYYEHHLHELKNNLDNEESPYIQWALYAIPNYNDKIRPGLEAKIRRMQ